MLTYKETADTYLNGNKKDAFDSIKGINNTSLDLTIVLGYLPEVRHKGFLMDMLIISIGDRTTHTCGCK